MPRDWGFWGIHADIRIYRLDWFDLIVTPMAYLIPAAIYSWWIDYWLKGMSVSLLLFIMGWMVME